MRRGGASTALLHQVIFWRPAPGAQRRQSFPTAAADAKPAYFRLDEEKSQLGDLLRLSDEEHTTDDLAIPLGDPTTLKFRVVLPDELRHDLRHERLEPLIPAILSGVEDAVAVDDPAHVAGQVGPEKVRDHRLGRNAEKPLDGLHRSDQAFLLCCRHAIKHRAYVVARARVERSEGLPASLRKPQ